MWGLNRLIDALIRLLDNLRLSHDFRAGVNARKEKGCQIGKERNP
jgi:hypothetical protein